MNGFGSMLKDYLNYYKISQTDFADKLGITQKHINNILNENAYISEELMLAISLITDIDVNLICYVENKKRVYNNLINKYKDEKGMREFLKSFYLNEMCKKEWIKLKDETSIAQNALDLLKYLDIRSFDAYEEYVNKRVLYKKKDDADLKKVYLWIKRCDYLASKQKVNEYKSSNISIILEILKDERNKKFNEKKLIEIFNSNGIYLVIEDALLGTKTRGCSLVKKTNPAIYMTKMYKEKSSFYYALYHEISHIKSNYNMAKKSIIVESENNIESKADLYSINQMINPDIWNEILNDFDSKEVICKKNKIPLCFLYSRLAHDKIISYNSKEYNLNKEIIF